MSQAELAVALLVVGALLGAVETVLVELWWRRLWQAPALLVARRAAGQPRGGDVLISALAAALRDSAFTALQFRELRPGFVAIREALWDRRPHLGYWPILLASLRFEEGAIALAIRPYWALWPLVAGGLLAVTGGGLLWLAGWGLLALLAWGGLVQGLRLRRLLRIAAGSSGSP